MFLESKTIVDLFILQAEMNPDAIAVRSGEEYLTYRQLHERTNQLAHYLQEKGVRQETVIPVLLGPGIDMVTAIFGIWKAGAAYAPVDPGYPEERIAYMLNDMAYKVVLGNKNTSKKLASNARYSLVLTDEDWPLIGAAPVSTPSGLPSPGNLAYIIYTSGSTGRPKGVMVEHVQLYTYIMDVYARLELAECDSYAIIGTFSADAGHTAVYSALCLGKSISIIDVKRFSNFNELTGYFEKFPVDCYKTTPSLMEFFLSNEGAYKIIPRRRLILGGEACPRALANTVLKMLPKGSILYNHYGPTETTVGVITYTFPSSPEALPEMIPLGMPLDNVRTYILKEDEEPARDGDTGELCIGGLLLARGYLNNPELTEQKFMTYSVAGEEKRLYRTGDLVRMLPDGNLACLGRIDDQVKINGYRVELREIESVISESGMVRQCIVLARHTGMGRKYLAGYIIPREEAVPPDGSGKDELVETLKRKLPDYMIPSRWVILKEWPLTMNNKIDKMALPDPETGALKEPGPYLYPADETGAYPADETGAYPADETGTVLIDIWRQLLGLEEIGIRDNFFELGGDSMLLIKLSFEIYDRLNIEISAAALFEYLTIEKLACFLSMKSKVFDLADENGLAGFDPMEASDVQKKFFLRNRLKPSESFPNSSLTYEVKGDINIARLEHAFSKIITENESLRTTYRLEKGKLYKKFVQDFDLRIECIRSDQADIDEEIAMATRAFDLCKAPMIRVFLIETGAPAKYLHIDMPHINSDGESLKIIMNDLEAIYNNNYAGSKRWQFTDFQRSVYRYPGSPQYKADELFWRKQFAGDIDLHLNFSVPENKLLQFEGVFAVDRLPAALYDRLGHYIKKRSLTKFQLMLIAYFMLLHKITGARHFAVMVPVRNRNEKRFEDVVGLLSNVIPIKVDIGMDDSIDELIDNCKDTIVRSISHQRCPFANIRNIWMENGRDIKHLSNTYFGYHYSKTGYVLGDTSLKLHIPLKTREKLPISAAVFQTESGLVMRLSSTVGAFNEPGLKNFLQLYFGILEQVMSADKTTRVGSLIKNF